MNRVLVILGPTATGKTDLGLDLARKFNGEIIACDSRQVYKYLDIGTGKLPGKFDANELIKGDNFWAFNGIKIWMYDVVEPQIQFTASDYVSRSRAILDEILKQNKLPIIVGGTGFYLQALLEGFIGLEIPPNRELRESLEKKELNEIQLMARQKVPERWSKLNDSDRKNKRRLIRIIEISMYPYIRDNSNNVTKISDKLDLLKIGLTAPLPYLYQRIDLRIDSWMIQGFIEEGEMLLAKGLSTDRMNELGLEYRYLGKYLSGELNKEDFIRELKIKNHQYAKRQITWFKRDNNICWFDITENNYQERVAKAVESWYHPDNG